MEYSFWPQILAPTKVILVGGFHLAKDKRRIFNKALLNQDKIIYFAEGNFRGNPLKNSSLAVSLFLGRSLNLCSHQLLEGKLEACLKEKSQEFVFDKNKKMGRTLIRTF